MGKNKVPMVGYRPATQADYDWLVQTAKDNGMSINALIKLIIDQHRYGYEQR